jgi:hypothetical protein
MTNIGMATQAAEMTANTDARAKKYPVLSRTTCISWVCGMFFLAAIQRGRIAAVNHT